MLGCTAFHGHAVASPVPRAQVLRNHDIQALPHRLLGGEAEQALRRVIPKLNAPIAIGKDHRIGALLNDGRTKRLGDSTCIVIALRSICISAYWLDQVPGAFRSRCAVAVNAMSAATGAPAAPVLQSAPMHVLLAGPNHFRSGRRAS